MNNILLEKYGQLCNNLWSYLPFILESIRDTNKQLKILGFDDYIRLFEDLSIYNNITFYTLPIKGKKIQNLYFRLLHLIYQILGNRRILTYQFCKINITQKYQLNISNNELEKIKLLFQPESKYIKHIQDFFSHKKKNHIIIGIHVRRGDYKIYRNGIWYFEDEVYLNYIRQIKNLFPENIKISFFISSNEKNHIEDSEIDFIKLNNTNMIQDLFTLSKCDYILGPHSTFSMWASFYGQKPLRFIETAHDIIYLDDFKIIREFNEI